MPCLIKKASRCVADGTSKTVTFFIFHFLYLFISVFIGSVVKIVLSEAATRGVLYKKMFLKFAKSTGKYLCQSLFLNKFAGATVVLTYPLTLKIFEHSL